MKVPSNHTCFFYKNDAQLLNRCIPYLFDKVEPEQTLCVWILPAGLSVQIAKTYLKYLNKNYDVKGYLKRQQLVLIENHHWYYHEKPFNFTYLIAEIEKMVKHAKKIGCTKIRATGDIGSVDTSLWHDLVNYETMMNNFLIMHNNLHALCTYHFSAYSRPQIETIASLHYTPARTTL